SLSSIAVQADAQAGALKLAGESDAKDRRIVELQKEVEDRSAWAQRLDEEIAAKNRRIVELQKEVEGDRSAWAQRLDEEIAAKNGRIVELQNEVEDRSAWALRNENRACEAEARLDLLINSKSWRITRPLRSVSSVLKKFTRVAKK